MPVLFDEISADLGLSLVSIGMIWGLDPLAGIFIGLPGGLLVDRFGIKRTLTVVCLLAGIFSALRGFSFNFATLAGTTFLFGIMAAMTPSIVPKTTAVWFARKQLGLTNALLQVAWSLGGMFATLTSATILSPLLGGWQNVLFFYGAPAVLLGMLWLITGREPSGDEASAAAQFTQEETPGNHKSTRPAAPANVVPLRQALSHVTRIKEVWLLGFIALTFWGANMGLNGYLPLYLRGQGWTDASADSAMTSLIGTTLVGVIPMVLLANRLNAQKGMFFFGMITQVISLALIPLVSGSPSWMWTLLIISGLLRSAFPALMNALTFEVRGVGGTYGGTAIGLASSIGMAGACFAPPLGNSLEVFGSGMPFFFWAALSAAGWPIFIIYRKLSGPRGHLNSHFKETV